ncbi:hypothetical protein U1Q18_049503, partial [Sarracenia purpurea var. burkii]
MVPQYAVHCGLVCTVSACWRPKPRYLTRQHGRTGRLPISDEQVPGSSESTR